MNQTMLSSDPHHELIIHSFNILKKLKECVDTIFVNEDLSLSTNRFEPHNYYHLSTDLVNHKTSFFIVLEATSHKNPLIKYYLNHFPLLGDISSFKPESQNSVQWLYENFSPESQTFDNLIFKRNSKIFIEGFVEIINTTQSPSLSFNEALKQSIHNLSPVLCAMNRLDIKELKSWVETYAVWEEKQKINEELGEHVDKANNKEENEEIKGKLSFKI